VTAAVVLIAGATGRIGTAFAQRVLARGGRVAAVVRRPWQVEALQRALGRERTLVGVVATGDAEAAAGFVKGAQDALGAIDVFAGLAGSWETRLAAREPGDPTDQLAANLIANATLARAVLPAMRRRRRGVLDFAGAADAELARGSAAFAAGKGALHAYTLALARDLEGSGVAVRTLLLTAADVAAPAIVAERLDAPAGPAAAGGGACSP
jgi:NADP-dependent 3-hydroxy acid dehydrogenase YdfG